MSIINKTLIALCHAVLGVIGRVALYTTLVLTWVTCLAVFRVFNRTHVYGRRPPLRRGLLVVSNHQSLIDSFLVGLVVYYPELLERPGLAPYHLADAKNFMTHPILRFVYDVLRVIPVGRNERGERSDHGAFRAAFRTLQRGGTLHVFIEGMRSPNDELLPPKVQIGALALDTGVTVLPVYFTGMHDVFPYRKRPGDSPATWWRIFGTHTEWLLDWRVGHQMHIAIGEPMLPVELKQLAGDGDHRSQVTKVANGIMYRIACLRKRVVQSLEPAAI